MSMGTTPQTAMAMHMGNELLSWPVAAVTLVLAAAAVAIAARRATHADSRRLALMGVLGAFVFAAQMINVPILPGISGHLAGGVLLAIVLGPQAAILVMAAILIVQCLLFQDGGVLALGCNIINMGVVPCVVGSVIYRGAVSRGHAATWRRWAAAGGACIVAVVGGSAAAALQAGVSGVLQMPVRDVLITVVSLHVLIGVVEGVITCVVLDYLRRVRPVAVSDAGGPSRMSASAVAMSLLIAAVILAGGLSVLASESPDGLEAAMSGKTAPQPSAAVRAADAIAHRVAPMPDYTIAGGWGPVAGLAGTAVTLALVWAVGIALKRRQGRQAPSAS